MFDSIASEAIRGRAHPHTGEPITPVGFRKNGRPIWPIMGAAPGDDEGGDDEGGDDESGDDEGGDDEGSDDEGSDDDDDDAEKERKRKAKANKDTERQRRINKKLQDDLDAANKRLKEVDDKDKDEVTRLTEAATEANEKLEKAEARAQELALHNAFLSDNSITWHDPQTALALVDLSDVEIDEDGEVEGLEEALKDLAKKKPFLVKTTSDDDDEDEDPKKRTSTGQPPKKRKTVNDKDRQKLIDKYNIRR
jgi:hypothetical protein